MRSQFHCPAQLRSQLKQQSCTWNAQCICSAAEQSGWWHRRTHHRMNFPGGFNPPLKHRTVERMECVFGAEVVEHRDNAVAADIRGKAHRRTPVALANCGAFVKQSRICGYELANGIRIVVPDRIDQIACLDKPHPARRLVHASKHELRVSKRCGFRSFP